MARLAAIARYPVKSVGGETLDRVTLTAGQILPGDRRFAVIHADALHHLDGEVLRKWLPKSAFLRGAAGPALQAVRGGWDGGHDSPGNSNDSDGGPDRGPNGGALVLTHPDRPPLRFDPAGDDAPLIAWLAPLWADSGKAAPARLVEAPQPLTDVRQPYVSILSLSSLAELERRTGRPLGTDRWRGNLWIDGWEAFAEQGFQKMTLHIGTAELRVRDRIVRCAATSANSVTGRIDSDMPAELERLRGAPVFGIYAEVVNGGSIAVGDEVRVA